MLLNSYLNAPAAPMLGAGRPGFIFAFIALFMDLLHNSIWTRNAVCGRHKILFWVKLAGYLTVICWNAHTLRSKSPNK